MNEKATPKKKDKEDAFSNDVRTTSQKSAGAFTRKAAVTVPVLKIPDNGSVYVRIISPIEEKQTVEEVTEKDASGRDVKVQRPKVINTIRVIDLQSGDDLAQRAIVAGVVLARELSDYQGGNGAYVGKCFEITKRPAPEGKRSKRYEVYEIEDPDHK